MTLHYAPTTPEEEELAIALALSASLTSGKASGPSIQRESSLSFPSSGQSSKSGSAHSSSGGNHPPPAAPPSTSAARQAASASQPHRSASQQPPPSGPRPPPSGQQPPSAAWPVPLPPGLGSPPQIFPTRLPLPTPRAPTAASSRPGPQHHSSSSSLPPSGALPQSHQPPSNHNRGAPTVSPPRSRAAWGSGASTTPRGQAAPPAGPGPSHAASARPTAASHSGGISTEIQPAGRQVGPLHAGQPAPALPPPEGRSRSASGPSGIPSTSGRPGAPGPSSASGAGAGSSYPSRNTGAGGSGSSGGGSSSSSGSGAAAFGGSLGSSAGGGGKGGVPGGTYGGGSTQPPRGGTGKHAPAAARPAAPPALPPAPQLHSDPKACAGCGRGFGLFGTDCITGMNRKWHIGCFRCGFCAEPISTGRGSFTYNMHPGDPRPYHPDCYRHAHHPLCTVCATYIAPGDDGRISYRENGFWRQRYCGTHREEDLTRCCACSRLQQKGEEWAPLPDGRPLCLQCLSSTVLDTREAQPLYEEVLRFYAEEMRLPHPYKPPLLLVDGPTLNEHATAEGRDDSEGGPVFHVRGLCVAQVYSTIPAILRGLGGGLRSVATTLSGPGSPSSSCSPFSPFSPAASTAAPRRAHCHVSVLLLLYGLPRLLSGSIMAHELMHAWLRMAGLVGLPLRTEEGLCQLMACLWLDRQHELLQADPDEQRLASFFSYQIRTDTSDVYGEGFREAMEAFQAHGLTFMIQNLKMYGSFTPP